MAPRLPTLTVWISESCGAGLRGSSGEHHPHKVGGGFGRLFLLVHVLRHLGLQQAPFDAFVDHKVNDSLRDARVGGRHAPVEAAQAVQLIDPPYALQRAHPSLASIPGKGRGKKQLNPRFDTKRVKRHVRLPGVQLQTSLDEPYRVGGRDGCKTCGGKESLSDYIASVAQERH